MLQLYTSPEDYLAQSDAAESRTTEVVERTRQIIEQVRREGDAGVKQLTRRFDGHEPTTLRISQESITAEQQEMPEETRNIVLTAIEHVRAFHARQRPASWLDAAGDGSRLGMRYTPITSVGVYVPGGAASYPSTVIMTVVPAQIAGVNRIALISPPGKEGAIDALVLATAGLLNVKEIYTVGGAQAIAALAYGTETIPKVDKIVGPGNAYVNEAKRQVFGQVGIDQLAGPSEVVILADASANPEYLLKDLCAQAEHDNDARVILITPSKTLAQTIQSEVERHVQQAPRSDILRSAMKTFGAVVLVSSLKEGLALINEIAPEHLQLFTQDPDTLLPEIRNAGAICLGEFTPAVVGDYFAGPNHVLPTGGTARFSSPLNVLDFMKFSSVLHYTKQKLRKHGHQISRLAELEGLLNHKNAIQCRL